MNKLTESNCRLCDTDTDVDPVTLVCARCTTDRAVYDGQPYQDSTGIPPHVKQRCGKCRKDMRIVAGTQHFDADGGAMVETVCDTCRLSSCISWVWSTGEAPATDEDLCDECGRNPRLGHGDRCPLKGQPLGVLRTATTDDDATDTHAQDGFEGEHEAGDGCATYSPEDTVMTDDGPTDVEDLTEGDRWRDPQNDAADVWWVVDEVETVGDDVHIAFSPAV